MKLLDPVIWTKGTFLNPQHLQTQDRRLEQILQFDLEALVFAPWGFRKLQIDRRQLAAGTIAITEAAGIFPDGLLFDLPAPDPAPPPRSLKECFGPDQDSVDVFLVVPQYREGGLNIAGPHVGAETRYRAELTMIRDENTGLNEKPVQLARKNLRIVVEGEAREGVSALRAGRVRRTPAGTYELDMHCVPPVIDFRAGEYLVSIARGLVELLAARSTEIATVRRHRSQTLADFTSSDIANFWLLYTVNAHFPVLRHLFEERSGHPEALYNEMLRLAAELTAFSMDLGPRDLPPYDHNELGPCFAALDEKLRSLLATVVPKNFVALPLKLTQPSIYAAALDEEKYLSNTRMYLALHAEMNQGELIQKAAEGRLLKVCSATHIERLVSHGLPGVPLTHVTSPPASLPVKLQYQYFSLGQAGPAWDAIVRSRNLAAYVPGDFPDAQLELIIILPQTE
jgi:type VI secretion system protein ImpJ